MAQNGRNDHRKFLRNYQNYDAYDDHDVKVYDVYHAGGARGDDQHGEERFSLYL